MYRILIKRQAKKKLQSLTPSMRAKMAGFISMLGIDPDDARLSVKKLHGKAAFRLRVGQWRLIFERDDVIKVISIEKIGAWGDVYK